MPDDPRQKRFFDAWEADQAEGITIRALHRLFHEHVHEDREGFHNVRLELDALKQARAYDAGAQAARTSGGAYGEGPGPTGTGRFYLPPGGGPIQAMPLAPIQPLPPPTSASHMQPIPPMVSVNIEQPNTHHRHSSKPAAASEMFTKVFQSTAAKIIGVILVGLLGWLTRHFWPEQEIKAAPKPAVEMHP